MYHLRYIREELNDTSVYVESSPAAIIDIEKAFNILRINYTKMKLLHMILECLPSRETLSRLAFTFIQRYMERCTRGRPDVSACRSATERVSSIVDAFNYTYRQNLQLLRTLMTLFMVPQHYLPPPGAFHIIFLHALCNYLWS